MEEASFTGEATFCLWFWLFMNQTDRGAAPARFASQIGLPRDISGQKMKSAARAIFCLKISWG